MNTLTSSTPHALVNLDDVELDLIAPERTLETHGPDPDYFYFVKINHGTNHILWRLAGKRCREGKADPFNFDDAPLRPQRSRKHEQDVEFVDNQNMTRVKNLLDVAKERGQLSHEQLREIIYRIEITHPTF